MLDPVCFDYIPGFIPQEDASEYLQRLRWELAWEQKTIRIHGRERMQPRLVAWYGDPEARYRYSGLNLRPNPWHPVLQQLRQRVSNQCGVEFNSVLANAYRNGQDSMGWHRDNEPELGNQPVIASLSLGEQRRFLLRHDDAPRSEPLELENGSLLVMKGDSQRMYRHSLPKTRRLVSLRINLTFRRILTVERD